MSRRTAANRQREKTPRLRGVPTHAIDNDGNRVPRPHVELRPCDLVKNTGEVRRDITPLPIHISKRKRGEHIDDVEPMRVELLFTVCTHELIHELREWLPTARMCYPRMPLTVFTDADLTLCYEMAAELNVENVKFRSVDREHALTRVDNVPRQSPHWKMETIWLKLECLRVMVEENPDRGVLLADCDITFIAPNTETYYGDVVLSPNFCGDLQKLTRSNDGKSKLPLYLRDSPFNAGHTMTRSLEFCEWWINAFENANPEDFTEQTALEQAPRMFDVAYFDERDNFGKWRFKCPAPNVRTVHIHIHERAKVSRVTMLKIVGQQSAAKARKLLRENPQLRS